MFTVLCFALHFVRSPDIPECKKDVILRGRECEGFDERVLLLSSQSLLSLCDSGIMHVIGT